MFTFLKMYSGASSSGASSSGASSSANLRGYCPVPTQNTNASCIYSATGELRCSEPKVCTPYVSQSIESFCGLIEKPRDDNVLPIGEFLDFSGRPLDYTGGTMPMQFTPTCKDQMHLDQK